MLAMYVCLLKKKTRKYLLKSRPSITHTSVPEQQLPGKMGRNHVPFQHHVKEQECLLDLPGRRNNVEKTRKRGGARLREKREKSRGFALRSGSWGEKIDPMSRG